MGPFGHRPFSIPARQTGRADFRHPAFRLASQQNTRRDRSGQALEAQNAEFSIECESAIVPPRHAIADGALGFWKAAGEVWQKTREQRCWVHKTANVLARLPKSQQPKAKRALQEIWMAETKAAAELAFDAFIESFTPKYAKAADCLSYLSNRTALAMVFKLLEVCAAKHGFPSGSKSAGNGRRQGPA